MNRADNVAVEQWNKQSLSNEVRLTDKVIYLAMEIAIKNGGRSHGHRSVKKRRHNEKAPYRLIQCFFVARVSDGTRTHGLQGHNLTL